MFGEGEHPQTPQKGKRIPDNITYHVDIEQVDDWGYSAYAGTDLEEAKKIYEEQSSRNTIKKI